MCYFQVCEGVRRINRALNLHAWAWFIPIYANIYISTVNKALNQIIAESKLGEKIDEIKDNMVLNFLFPFAPFYKIFQVYNDLADEMEERLGETDNAR